MILAAVEPNTNLPIITANESSLKFVLQMAFGIIAFVALIVIILAGFKYITSQGNPQANKQAWQTILYASIGLLVALSAEAVVALVMNRV
jgi:hypothetical protein